MRVDLLHQTELFYQKFARISNDLKQGIHASKQAIKQAIERAKETVSLRKPGLKEGRCTHTYHSNIINKSLRRVFLPK